MVHSRGRLEIETRCAEQRDLDELVAMHRACFPASRARPAEELRHKLAGLFLDGPLVSPALPSLVGCDGNGTVVGFRGWLSRRWRLGEELLPGRCGTHIMTHPDHQRVGVGATLKEANYKIRETHSENMIGFGDRSTDDGRAFSDGTQVAANPLYRLEQYGFIWELPLRRLATRESRGLGRRLGLTATLNERMAGIAASLRPSRSLDLSESTPLSGTALCAESLTDTHAALGADFPLHLDEPPETWHWIVDYLRDYESRGRFEGRVLLSPSGDPVGFYAAYQKPTGTLEVVGFAALADFLEPAIHQLLRDAGGLGVHTVYGWASARELRTVVGLGAQLFEGRRAAVNTHRDDVRLYFESMEALFSGLEGERWL